jgi:hypothetical protein
VGEGAAEKSSRLVGRSEESDSVLRHGRSVAGREESGQRSRDVESGRSLADGHKVELVAHANVSALVSSVGIRSPDRAS